MVVATAVVAVVAAAVCTVVAVVVAAVSVVVAAAAADVVVVVVVVVAFELQLFLLFSVVASLAVCAVVTVGEIIMTQFTALVMLAEGGAVASWLVRSTPERAVRVRALAGDIVLCSWARYFTLTVPLSTQVYKCKPSPFSFRNS